VCEIYKAPRQKILTALLFGTTVTKPRLWEELNLSQWGRVKAMADYLSFEVQRLKRDQCRLLMPNIKAKNILASVELTDSLTNIEFLLHEAVEEAIDQRFNRNHEKNK
jgi:hypothetical protein